MTGSLAEARLADDGDKLVAQVLLKSASLKQSFATYAEEAAAQ